MQCTIFAGELTDNHDLVSMKLYELEVPEGSDDGQEDRRQRVPGSSFFESPRDHVEDPKPSSMSGMCMTCVYDLGVLDLADTTNARKGIGLAILFLGWVL